MKKLFFSRLVLLSLILMLVAQAVPAQVTTSGRLAGVVTDAQGALIPKAQIVAVNDQTRGEYKAVANDEGSWNLPSLSIGTYTVTVTAPGFKTTVNKGVKVEVGQVASLNTVLETGGATEQVVVTAAGEVLHTESATVATTLSGRQIGELPFSTRDALTLVTTLPGVLTPDKPRTSSINGLPKGSVNLTLDGANIQDNFLRSSDGFFTSIQAKSDAVQEVTVTTATPGAESAGEGAVQVRFVTKSGSPEYHGGAFWQYRSKTFNSNYYFNNIDGLPRDAFILRQYGGNIGGPILIPGLLKNREKAFFFVNYEYFDLPNAYGSLLVNSNILVLTDDARNGIFTYADSAGALHKVNLYQLAGSKGFTSTPDPTIAKAFDLINGYVHTAGALNSRVPLGDYNRLDYQFQDPGLNKRWFPTARFDWNITAKHHAEFIHNYQHYFSLPDGVNGQINVYPGSGIVVGHPGQTGSVHRNTFSFVAAERWTINERLVNELRATSSGNGTSLFFQEFDPRLYDFWGGYAVASGTSFGGALGGAFYNRRSQSRRNTPVKGLSDNLSILQGTHSLNVGVAFTRVAAFNQGVDTQVIPRINLGLASGDPVNTGSTAIFTTGNFPGSTSAQRTLAGTLYAVLTGRVSSINRSASFDGQSFDFKPLNEYSHQQEYAIYAQDSWKLKPNLTLNYGLRWEIDPSPLNDNNVYTRVGIEGIFGVSGDGNLFKPGVFTGKPTAFRLLEDHEKAFVTQHKNFAPSVGVAWSPESRSGLLGKLFGQNGRTVLRGGYSIAYTREGFNAYEAMFGSNDGPKITLDVSPSISPDIFTAGGVLFRNGNFPIRQPPSDTSRFPLIPGAFSGTSANDFDPGLRPGYTQSWTFGLQRELDKATAVEVRYVGTHGTHLWRQMDYNEVNIFENGFLDQFKAAQNNLAIFAKANPSCVILEKGPLKSYVSGTCNYGNSGLPGQVNVPLITTAIGSSTDQTTAIRLLQGQAGNLANDIAATASRMTNLMNASLIPFTTLANGQRVSNFFIVNPQTTAGAYVMTNGINTTFNALQIELRRRLSSGLLVQASYQYAKALSNSYSSSATVFSNPRTLRDQGLDKAASPWDIRHSFKVDWIYELPVGPGKPFLATNNPVLGRLLEGWQFGGVATVQSGPSTLLQSGRYTYDQSVAGNTPDAGLVLHNISLKQLQDMVKIRKTTNPVTGRGVVYWLPQSLIDNTLAAFELGGKTLKDLDPNAPYLGPPTTPGELGDRIIIYGPMTARFDLNLVKRIHVTEKTSFEGRVQFLNAFNRPNFFIGDLGSVNDPRHLVSVNSDQFGQTRAAYRDPTVSGTNDPGGRLIEFQLRFKF